MRAVFHSSGDGTEPQTIDANVEWESDRMLSRDDRTWSRAW